MLRQRLFIGPRSRHERFAPVIAPPKYLGTDVCQVEIAIVRKRYKTSVDDLMCRKCFKSILTWKYIFFFQPSHSLGFQKFSETIGF